MDLRSAAPLILALMIPIAVPSAANAQDAGTGERLFRQRCAACHALVAGQNRVGPHLSGVIGRKAGSIEGARYSPALKDSQIVWTEEMLESFLANPRQAVAGTSMTVGVPNGDQRQAIIAYLKSAPAPAN